MSLSRLLFAVTLAAPLAGCHGSQGEKAALPPKAAAESAGSSVAMAAPAAAPAAASEGAAAVPVSPPVAATAAKPADAASEYRLTGEVASVRKSQVAFRVAGTIATVTARPGNTFKKGEVLATLDARDFAVKVDLAKARVEGVKVTLDEAEREFKREAQLQKENASTATTFDKMRADFEGAKIQLKLAQLDLQTAELALSDTRLVAPYDCAIAQQFKYDGEAVQPTPPAPVLEVYDMADPEINFSAPERLVGQVQIGSKLSVAVPSAGFAGKAQVIRMVPVITEKTRSFQVTAKLTAVGKQVVPGSYAEATID